MIKSILLGSAIIWVSMLVACQPTPRQSPPPPFPPEDPAVPNCAADGPDCKQFNPDKPKP